MIEILGTQHNGDYYLLIVISCNLYQRIFRVIEWLSTSKKCMWKQNIFYVSCRIKVMDISVHLPPPTSISPQPMPSQLPVSLFSIPQLAGARLCKMRTRSIVKFCLTNFSPHLSIKKCDYRLTLKGKFVSITSFNSWALTLYCAAVLRWALYLLVLLVTALPSLTCDPCLMCDVDSLASNYHCVKCAIGLTGIYFLSES